MSFQEQRRVVIVARMAAGQMTGAEGAALLGRSVRQVRRLVAGYRQTGVAALAHGNRGRPNPRAVTERVRTQVLACARGPYAGCNDSHLTEILAEREGLVLSRSTVRRILRAAGIGSRKTRRAPQHRRRRERYPQEGLLLQVDGSHHAWLEERGPRLVLLAAIDDATGMVPAAVFWPQEDHWGYLELLRQIAQEKGLPAALYSDRHGVFWRAEKETLPEQLSGTRTPTQVGRVLEALGIGLLYARSPQAKGRVERLWGTLQDRLVAELRWANATTQAEANALLAAFLPRFNARFAVPAAQPGSAYRAWPGDRRPADVFCVVEHRVVAADNTVRWHGQLWQILPTAERASYARARVEVREQQDGSVTLVHAGQPLRAARLPPPPVPRPVAPQQAVHDGVPRVVHPPAPAHPWRARGTFSQTR